MTYAVFFLSGLLALVYEAVWFQRLALVLGSTSQAVAAATGGFLFGLGAGALLGGRIAPRLRRPLAGFGLCELLVGGFALAVPAALGALRGVGPLLGPEAGETTRFVARLLASLLVLFVPTALMGATLPMLVEHLERRGKTSGAALGGLYGLNALGGALGSLVAGFWLLPRLGFSGSNRAAALVSLTIGLAVLVTARRQPLAAASPCVVPALLAPPASQARGRVLAAAFLLGASALVLQGVWIRQSALLVGGSIYAFTAILAVVLAGIGGGAWLARPLARHAAGPAAPALFLLTALVLLAGIWLGQHAPEDLVPWVDRWRPRRGEPAIDALVVLGAATALALVPSLVLGLLFPLLVACATAHGVRGSVTVGRVYAANTLGTLGGAWLVALWLVPTLGLRGAVQVALLGIALGLGLVLARRARPRPLVLVLVAGLLAAGSLPRGDPRITDTGAYLYGAGILGWEEPLFHAQGRTANVLVTQENEGGGRFLRIDGKIDGGSTGDMDTQLALAYLPRLLRPRAAGVFVVGFGTGVTAGASALFPHTRVVCCEIEPEVLRAGAFFAAWNHDALTAPGLVLVQDDARSFLEASDERFDLVLSEPSNPWLRGTAALFTREFYELVRARLEPGGLLAQWVQAYQIDPADHASIVHTLRSVFPHVALARVDGLDTILLASLDPILPGDDELEAARVLLAAAPQAVRDDLVQGLGCRGVDELLLGRLFLDDTGLERLLEAQPRLRLLTDDDLWLEFSTPRSMYAASPGPTPADAAVVSAARAAEFLDLRQRLQGPGPKSRLAPDSLLPPLVAFVDHARLDEAGALLEASRDASSALPSSLEVEGLVLAALRGGERLEVGRLSGSQVRLAFDRLWDLGAAPRALVLLRAELEARPESSRALPGLAADLRARGRREEAERALEAALRTEPSAAGLQALLESLRAP